MRLFPWLVMCCAAFSAGAINSIAGGGTLITFPVLIWLGLDPKVANGTSTVALWPGLFGGLFGYRHELANSSPILIRLGLTSVLGGAVGARSEERRVGKECRSGWWTERYEKSNGERSDVRLGVSQ